MFQNGVQKLKLNPKQGVMIAIQISIEFFNKIKTKKSLEFRLRRLLKIRQFVEMIAQYDPLERKQEIKPFSCKLCDKSFFQVYKVKEHIKIHNSISEVEDLKNQVKSLKSQVEIKSENGKFSEKTSN